eukprot:TRINITY_DN7325_c0_g1_i4.p1 TRINITY_DN7325_c0_g1~~TRINITY_DN7325_c0_g1_i4.p1  ORF type:complete len:275 (-),score=9.18 TRINITY_DN7325_c0_g1_i4:1910-2734(-)
MVIQFLVNFGRCFNPTYRTLALLYARRIVKRTVNSTSYSKRNNSLFKRDNLQPQVYRSILAICPHTLENMTTKRRCSVCFTDSTPQWRRSRYTHKDLCNACGTRELRSAIGYMPSTKKKSGCRKTMFKQKHFPNSRTTSSNKDLEQSSSGTSSEACDYEMAGVQHELNQQEILSCLMMMRFEDEVKRADETVQVHPMYGGFQILKSMGQFDCPQEMDLIRNLLDLAVILGENYQQSVQQDDARIYEIKRKYCSLLQDIICMRTNKFQLPSRKQQ